MATTVDFTKKEPKKDGIGFSKIDGRMRVQVPKEVAKLYSLHVGDALTWFLAPDGSLVVEPSRFGHRFREV